MKSFVAILSVLVFVIASACGSKERDAMVTFDNSLDSLITGPVTYTTSVTVFEGDTLKGNPREVKDSYYYRATPESDWTFTDRIDARFLDHNLIRFSMETADHIKTIVNTVHYEREIDNEHFIHRRRSFGSGDSTLYGYTRWYDKKGNNIKSVQVISEEMRTLKIFRFDSLNRLSSQWERTRFTKLLSDSIYNDRITKTEYQYKEGFQIAGTRKYNNKVLVDSTSAHNVEPKILWRYEFDKQHNWIRRESPDGLRYVERKIVY